MKKSTLKVIIYETRSNPWALTFIKKLRSYQYRVFFKSFSFYIEILEIICFLGGETTNDNVCQLNRPSSRV